MLTSLLPASTQRLASIATFCRFPTLLGPIIAIALTMAIASPVQAWWLEAYLLPNQDPVPPQSVANLVVEPLKPLNGSFMLEPLVTPVKPSPLSTQIQTSVIPSPPQAVKVASASRSIAAEILDLVNQQRRLHSTEQQPLVDLRLNHQLMTSAQQYAELMRQLQFFSHTSPSGDTLKERNEAAGYTRWSWMGENIGYGQTTAEDVMAAWMDSEGHRLNILDHRARELGVGYAPGPTTYWVQEFGAQF